MITDEDKLEALEQEFEKYVAEAKSRGDVETAVKNVDLAIHALEAEIEKTGLPYHTRILGAPHTYIPKSFKGVQEKFKDLKEDGSLYDILDVYNEYGFAYPGWQESFC